MSSDSNRLPEKIVDDLKNEAPPLEDVTTTIPEAGLGDITVKSGCSTTDVTVQAIREPAADRDVSIQFWVSDTGAAELSLSEEGALAMIDAVHQALEVTSFDEGD